MKRAAIFAGTTEGREMAVSFAKLGFFTDVFVATEYGSAMLPKGIKNMDIHEGRMDSKEMERYFLEKLPSIVVDATHPYAKEVTAQLNLAAEKAGIFVYRLVREGMTYPNTVHNGEEAAEKLKAIPGNILLTTGSKELEIFCQEPSVKQRLYVRVLPAEDSIRKCRQLGILPSRIIAMQGPFSSDLNIALIHQFQIRVLVTKNSGTTGGFFEKLSAVQKCGIEVVVMERPQERGFTIEELQEIAERMVRT